ncbi:hypothetical protein Misp05_30420 [Micromonospora sp. NBRC 107095]|nr:hypothetical protein Misp05_30420 [Micromonospora sp. NBRC 107095]
MPGDKTQSGAATGHRVPGVASAAVAMPATCRGMPLSGFGRRVGWRLLTVDAGSGTGSVQDNTGSVNDKE